MHPLGHAGRVKSAADDVVTHAGQVAYTAAADEHHAVLLQVVANTRNVARTFDLIGQTDTGDLTQGGIGLFGGRGLNAEAHAALLRAALQDRSRRPVFDLFPSQCGRLRCRGAGQCARFVRQGQQQRL